MVKLIIKTKNFEKAIRKLKQLDSSIETGIPKLNKKTADFMLSRIRTRLAGVKPRRITEASAAPQIGAENAFVVNHSKNVTTLTSNTPHAIIVERGNIHPRGYVFLPRPGRGKHGQGYLILESHAEEILPPHVFDNLKDSKPSQMKRTGFWSLSIADTNKAYPRIAREFIKNEIKKVKK